MSQESSRDGFMLIEVVISIGVMAIMLSSIGMVFNITLLQSERADRLARVREVSEYYMEQEIASTNTESYSVDKGDKEILITITNLNYLNDNENDSFVELYQIEVEIRKEDKILECLKGTKVLERGYVYGRLSK